MGRHMMRGLVAALSIGSLPPTFAASPVDNTAVLFGARPWANDAELSPDATHLVFIAPGAGGTNAAVVEDLKDGSTTTVLSGNGKPFLLHGCGWSANDRIVCRLVGNAWMAADHREAYSRTIAADIDGGRQKSLTKTSQDNYFYDGEVIDWLDGTDGAVLMKRPEGGLYVERVDTRSGVGKRVEQSDDAAVDYLTDGSGHIRMVAAVPSVHAVNSTNTIAYRYRPADGSDWKPFSRIVSAYDNPDPGLRPIAVDGTRNVAYALDNRTGRDALYRVALDGSMKTDLVYADPLVDVDGVVTIGRHGRVIGATFVSDRRQVVYFDPDYKALAASLARALPDAPLIHFASASADERKLLVFATGDTDPGRFYLLDRDRKKMVEVLRARPELGSHKLAAVRAVSYPAADGTTIPAYLTLPPGAAGARGLPAIVMPHGGPSARDEWGFDWLSQYYAARGFAVLQPQYRGSSGYGVGFLRGNGLKSWRIAVSDILDAGRWLDRQGIADPAKLAIVGWSYGGYAALQANVVDPDLFKAAVAVAPVTSLVLLRAQYRNISIKLASRYFGDEAEEEAGSPVHHAAAIKVPVMMFHGDYDLNVGIGQSRAMQAALKSLGKKSVLVVYPGLDHQLADNDARADMLAKSDAFLRSSLGIAAPAP